MLARVPDGTPRARRGGRRADRVPRERPHDVLDGRGLRPFGRQARRTDGRVRRHAAGGSCGWAASPSRASGAIDPAAPAVVRELRERDPLAALRARPRALRRRGRGRARRGGSGDARAAAAARPARARRDLGGRRDLRAQPARAHRGERVLGRRVRARLRRRATRALPQGRRLPSHGRPRRGGRGAHRIDAGRCRSRSWRLVLGRGRLDHRGDRRQRPDGARHRGREPALPAAGQDVRGLLLVRPGGARSRRLRLRPTPSRCASGTPTAHSSTRTRPARRRCTAASRNWPRGASARTPSRRLACCSPARAWCRPTTWRWRPGYRVEVEVEGIGVLANPVRAA